MLVCDKKVDNNNYGDTMFDKYWYIRRQNEYMNAIQNIEEEMFSNFDDSLVNTTNSKSVNNKIILKDMRSI